MKIYGAGLAGLIAGHMLRRHEPTIVEAQPSLPNNHAALLRFRTNNVSTVTGVPFKKVLVSKNIYQDGNFYNEANIKFSNMYAIKVSGKAMTRSILNLDPVERYIAPPDFINQLSKSLSISYNLPLQSDSLDLIGQNHKNAILSTIPMNLMMDLVGWKDKPEFLYKPIWSITCDIIQPACELYQTIYFPSLDNPIYRASITGNHLILESIEEISKDAAENFLQGFINIFLGNYASNIENVRVKKQNYGKLLPIDDNIRKQFIMFLTDNLNIYSIGRFATWRQILMDDVVEDIRIVEKMITNRDAYKQKLKTL